MSALRAGQRVSIQGRTATVVYLHAGGDAVVVRYEGERDTRVVALRKLHVLPDPPRAAWNDPG